MAGEGLRDYRVSVLSDLKRHSKVFKDTDLHAVADEAAFTNMEATIITDAISASNTHILPGQPLVKRTRVNADGHRITTFSGDSGIAWAPFMGGGTQFGRIVPKP